MLMTRARNDKRDGVGRFIPAFEAMPEDFRETFVRIGRLACEEHYEVGRVQITRWLDECGRDMLIAIRAGYVKRKEAERHAYNRLSRRDMHRVLARAFPVRGYDRAAEALARRAAHHLRIRRNGGWIISPMGDGFWRLGMRVVTAAELVEMAKAQGFSANLPGDE